MRIPVASIDVNQAAGEWVVIIVWAYYSNIIESLSGMEYSSDQETCLMSITGVNCVILLVSDNLSIYQQWCLSNVLLTRYSKLQIG